MSNNGYWDNLPSGTYNYDLYKLISDESDFYKNVSRELNSDYTGKDELSLSQQIKRACIRSATEMCFGNVTNISLWKSINPHDGNLCNFLKINNQIILLDNYNIALLRWLILRYDELKEYEIDTEEERKKLTPTLRYNILARDNFRCIYCGRSPKTSKIHLHVDHIIPVSKGGKTHPDNLVTSCNICNSGKSNNIYTQAINIKYLLDPPQSAYYWNWKNSDENELAFEPIIYDKNESIFDFLTRKIGEFMIFIGDKMAHSNSYNIENYE